MSVLASVSRNDRRETGHPRLARLKSIRIESLPDWRKTKIAALTAFLMMASVPTLFAEGVDIAISMDEREIRFAGITTTNPDKEQREIELSLPGTIVIPPQQLRVVAAPASGLVESLLAVTDEPVKAGDPVVLLRSMEFVEAQRQYLAVLAVEREQSNRTDKAAVATAQALPPVVRENSSEEIRPVDSTKSPAAQAG